MGFTHTYARARTRTRARTNSHAFGSRGPAHLSSNGQVIGLISGRAVILVSRALPLGGRPRAQRQLQAARASGGRRPRQWRFTRARNVPCARWSDARIAPSRSARRATTPPAPSQGPAAVPSLPWSATVRARARSMAQPSASPGRLEAHGTRRSLVGLRVAALLRSLRRCRARSSKRAQRSGSRLSSNGLQMPSVLLSCLARPLFHV